MNPMESEIIRPEEYAEQHRIDIFDAGPTGEMRLSALLCLCQNVSWEHLERLGVGYSRLRRDGLVFLILSNQAEIRRMPRYGETVTICTFPCGSSGVTFYRGFEITDAEGTLLVSLTQSSACVDPESHSLLRPKVFYAYGVFQEEKTPAERKISRIKAGEMPPVGERTVRYSDLDCNGHMNNTVYADVTEDFLPGGREGKTYTRVQIDYVSEARFGEELLLKGEEKDGLCILQGFHSRGLCFSARAEMRKL